MGSDELKMFQATHGEEAQKAESYLDDVLKAPSLRSNLDAVPASGGCKSTEEQAQLDILEKLRAVHLEQTRRLDRALERIHGASLEQKVDLVARPTSEESVSAKDQAQREEHVQDKEALKLHINLVRQVLPGEIAEAESNIEEGRQQPRLPIPPA